MQHQRSLLRSEATRCWCGLVKAAPSNDVLQESKSRLDQYFDPMNVTCLLEIDISGSLLGGTTLVLPLDAYSVYKVQHEGVVAPESETKRAWCNGTRCLHDQIVVTSDESKCLESPNFLPSTDLLRNLASVGIQDSHRTIPLSPCRRCRSL